MDQDQVALGSAVTVFAIKCHIIRTQLVDLLKQFILGLVAELSLAFDGMKKVTRWIFVGKEMMTSCLAGILTTVIVSTVVATMFCKCVLLLF